MSPVKKLGLSILGLAFLAVIVLGSGYAINSMSWNNRPMPTPTVNLAKVNPKNIEIDPAQDKPPVVSSDYQAKEPDFTLAEAKVNSDNVLATTGQPSLIWTPTPQVQSAGYTGQSAPQGATPTAQAVAQAPTVAPTPTVVQQVAEAAAAAAQAPAVQAAPSGLVGVWSMTWFPGADLNRGDGTTFRQDFDTKWPKIAEWPVEPAKWPTTNNIPNKLEPRFPMVLKDGKETSPEGVEIPQGEANYCQVVQGELCTNPVEPHSYMLYSGDGVCPDGTWASVPGKGNVLIIINVGDVTARFDCAFWQGWRNHGRYFGVTPLIGAVTLASHTGNVMHNLPSDLNPEGVVNAGGNCSVTWGCDFVHYTMIYISGNEKLARMDAETAR